MKREEDLAVSLTVQSLAEATRETLGSRQAPGRLDSHLRETMRWLCRAQDAVDGGVSRGFALLPTRGQWRSGWLAAYPETTGYIIPTFIEYFRFTGESDYLTRAVQMARWETKVQMSQGAVQGGVVGLPPEPTVFNTGQVLFGWVAAYEQTGDEAFLASAIRAADFLLSVQDSDGAWRRYESPYTHPGARTYDARTAWGLLETSRVSSEPRYREAAIRNLDFVLTQQAPNGWFANCCISDDERPLLHTIAYTMEGLLEASAILSTPRYLDAARKAADVLVDLLRPDGSLAARFDSKWQPTVRWTCLTGDAQTALVWLRLSELAGDSRYSRAARRVNRYLCGTQSLGSSHPGVRGGVKGSDPIWAWYGRYQFLNWAAKFLADSLMVELSHSAQ